MKRLLIVLLALSASVEMYGQNKPTTASDNNPNYYSSAYVQCGQMLNIANAYAGTFLDTPATGTVTTYLYTAINGSLAVPRVTPYVAADTFVPYPVTGDGIFTFVITGLKISGTPDGVLTLEQSNDGIIWGPYNADDVTDNADTVLDQAARQTYIKVRTVKSGLYYRWKLATAGTQQSSWSAYYCLQPRQSMILNK